ncbi:MAG: transporter substrate-binding domain-containing protein [Betaproteobacteria bacterium]
MNTLTNRLALLLVTGLLACAPAHALTLLTEENAPFNYTEGGKFTGLSTDMVTEMAKRAGIAIQIKVQDWDVAYTSAQAEKDTCVYSTARLENRERLFQWVGPLSLNRWAVFGKSDFAVPVSKLADLRPLKIGAVAADAKVDFLMSRSITNFRLAGRDAQLPPRLLLKKDDPNYVDLWITNFYSAKKVAADANVKDIKMVFVVREQDLYLACSPRTSKEDVKKLADALAAMVKDGAVKKIMDTYEKRFAP